MGILNHKLGISKKITAGDADIMGQYPIQSSGYFADEGRYPDNRSTWAHGDVLTTETKGGELLTAGHTSGGQYFSYTSYLAGQAKIKEMNGSVKYYRSGMVVSWEALEPTFAPTWLDDGIAVSKTAGNLSSLGESEI